MLCHMMWLNYEIFYSVLEFALIGSKKTNQPLKNLAIGGSMIGMKTLKPKEASAKASAWD